MAISKEQFGRLVKISRACFAIGTSGCAIFCLTLFLVARTSRKQVFPRFFQLQRGIRVWVKTPAAGLAWAFRVGDSGAHARDVPA
jgi:hypothetical protein